MEQRLTAQDLQIGDYFYRPDCTDKVGEIRKNGVIGLDSLRGLIPFSEIKGVPITPEVLKKIGFVTACEGYYRNKVYNTETDRYLIDVDLFCRNNCRILRCHKHEKSEYSGRIEYLHQLQQAMRLCRIRKEIKL